MEGNETEAMVVIAKKDFMNKATEVVNKVIEEHFNGEKAQVSALMVMTGFVFMSDVRKILFGDKPVASFTEKEFNNAVAESARKAMDKAADKGNSSAGFLISMTGTLFSSSLCNKLFPKGGVVNG